MTPYYSDDAVTIYHGDCRDVLPHVGLVDLVFTSPPYNLSEGGRDPSGSSWGRLRGGYATYTDDMPRHEYVAWQHEVLRACWASLAADGAIFYNHKPLARGNSFVSPFDLVPDELPIRQTITWVKGQGVQRSLWHFCPSYEWIFLIAREAFRTTTMSIGDVWDIRPPSGSEHPAAFPIGLPTLAIGATSAATVLDPFMGSGTTLRAAKDLGRKAIGIELDERYCEIAAKRMAQEVLDFGGAA